jgi:predicted Zn-dependent peptidase
VTPAQTIRATTLPSGLTVVTDAAPGVHSAAVGVWISAGARHEDSAAEGGVAHFAEHMLFKGTPTRTAQDISQAIESRGGHLNAYTGREVTAYHAHILADDAPAALEVIADMLRRATLPEDEVERERGVILSEIAMCADTPEDRAADATYATAWGGRQALGAPILGTPATVGAMTRAQVAGYIARAYRPSAMVLSAAGAVEHDAIVALAQRYFGDMEPGDAPPAPARARYTGGQAREARALEAAQLVLALPAPSRTAPDFWAAHAAAVVLGGGAASRLFTEVREKRGLAYAVGAHYAPYTDGGLLLLTAGTGAGTLAEAARVICGELTALASHATQAEAARARAQLRAALLMGREDMATRADMAARHVLFHGGPPEVDALLARIAAVDADAIARAARAMLSAGPLTLAAVGPVGGLPPYGVLRAAMGA